MSLKKNKIEITLAVILAVIFSVSVVVFLKKIELNNETIKVVRASSDLTAPKILTLEDIETLYVPKSMVPDEAIKNPEKIVGLVLTRDIIKGGWFSKFDLVFNRDPNSDGTILPPNALGLILPAGWFMGAIPKVRPHDYIYIYAATISKDNSRLSNAGLLLSNIPVIRSELQRDQTVGSILVALNSDQATVLARARANQVPLLIAVAAADGVNK